MTYILFVSGDLQVQEQLKREMARNRQIKAQIARQFDQYQSPQRMISPMVHGANMMPTQGGSMAGEAGVQNSASSAANQQLMNMLQQGSIPESQ